MVRKRVLAGLKSGDAVFKGAASKSRVQLVLVILLGAIGVIGNDKLQIYVEEIAYLPLYGEQNSSAPVSDLVTMTELPMFKTVVQSAASGNGVEESALDEIFSQPTLKKEVVAKKPPEPELEPEIKPDYARLAKEQFKLNALMDKAAVINNLFYEKGASLATPLISERGEHRVILVEVSPRGVSLAMDGEVVQVSI